MQSEVWQQRVLIFSIICHVILLWRLWSQKVARVYLSLTLFLAAEAVQNIIILPVRPRSTLYGWIYLLSTPVLWVLAYFVVLELYRLILEDYPGIASVGRKAVSWSLGLALLVSALYAIPDLRTSTGKFPVLRFYYIAERSIVLGLLLFLVLIQLFLFRYKLRLSPNRMIYATGYALYFGVGVAQDIIYTALGIRVVYTVDLWIVAAAGVILVGGAVLLSEKGEVRVQLEPVDSSNDRARLQQQLVDINRMLSRAARGR
jgi:signal transduction histidine kinase